MATCPRCKASSRTDPTFEIKPVLIAKPITEFSVAGQNLKVSANERLQLKHTRCGWAITGYIDGDHFVADPEVDTA